MNFLLVNCCYMIVDTRHYFFVDNFQKIDRFRHLSTDLGAHLSKKHSTLQFNLFHLYHRSNCSIKIQIDDSFRNFTKISVSCFMNCFLFLSFMKFASQGSNPTLIYYWSFAHIRLHLLHKVLCRNR